MRAAIPIATVLVVLVGIPVGAAAASSFRDASPRGASTPVATPNGKNLFKTSGCGSCHILKAAGAKGTIGPNLNRMKPSRARVIRVVTNGRGAMPSFKGVLNKAQIAAIATYVANNT